MDKQNINWNQPFKSATLRFAAVMLILIIATAVIVGMSKSKVKAVGLKGIKFDTGSDTINIKNENTHIKIGTVNGDVLTDTATKNVYYK